MKVNQFNQLVWAAIGLTILAGLLYGALQVAVFKEKAGKRGVPVAGQAADASRERPRSVGVYCTPVGIPGTPFQIIPVAIVTFDEGGGTLDYGSKSGASNVLGCSLPRVQGAAQVENMVVRNTATQTQSLLLDKPGIISHYEFHRDAANQGENCCFVPKGKVYWELRTADTNGDGLINTRDALSAFLSDVDGANLIRITPAGADLLSKTFDKAEQSLYFLTFVDYDMDGRLGAGDTTELARFNLGSLKYETPVVDPKINALMRERLTPLTHP